MMKPDHDPNRNIDRTDARVLLDSMNGIGDDLIAEAVSAASGKSKAKKPFYQRILPYAAAVLVLAGIGTGAALLFRNGPSSSQLVDPTGDIGKSGIIGTKETPVRVIDAGDTLPDSLKSLSVVPLSGSGTLIPTDTSFKLTAGGACDAETVASYVSMFPDTEISVRSLSDSEFEIRPAGGALLPGTIYRLSVGDTENPVQSFAFQTETEFFVKSVLPADDALYVPVRSGIEITFSESIDKSVSLPDSITVTPGVSGSILPFPDGRTVAFVPDSPLSYDTIYTVTVKAGIAGISGKSLAADRVFRFRTESKADAQENALGGVSISIGNMGELTQIFSPGDPAFLRVSTSAWGENLPRDAENTIPATGTLYRFPDIDTALESIRDFELTLGDRLGKSAADFPLQGLLEIGTYTSVPDDRSQIFEFGTELEPGVYLITAACSVTNEDGLVFEGSACGFFQVSNLRSYFVSSDSCSVLYTVSDDGTDTSGAAIRGYTYQRANGWNAESSDMHAFTAVSDESGLATISNGEDSSVLLEIHRGDDVLLAAYSAAPREDLSYSMHYLYTDREVYFSNDTVRISGFVTPAYPDERDEVPHQLFLETNYAGDRQPVRLSENGWFDASYHLEQMAEGGIYLKLCDADGRIFASKYIRVTESEKPVLTASISFDKLFYRYGETAEVTLHVSFFDGTPADGFEFLLSSDPFGFDGETPSYVTNQNGEVRVTIHTGDTAAWSTDPVSIYVYAELIGMETQTLVTSASVPYFHSDYVLNTGRSDDGSPKLTLCYRDVSKLLCEEDLSWPAFPENTYGEPAPGRITYRLIKTEYLRYPEQRYDAYSKKSYTYYRTEVKETQIDSGVKSFESGTILLPTREAEDFDGYYRYVISFRDRNNTYEYTLGASKRDTGYRKDTDRAISLNQERYALGDRIQAEYISDGDPIPRTLFLLCGNGIEKAVVTGTFESSYGASLIPGASLHAVSYNTETGLFETCDTEILFDRDSAKTPLTLTFDRDSYLPGDHATLKIRAPGLAGGCVTVSIADEACFALGEQNTDPFSYFGSAGSVLNDRYFGWYWDYGYTRRGEVRSVFSNQVINLFAPATRGYYDYVEDEMIAPAAMEKDAEAPDGTGGNGNVSDGDTVHVRSEFADNPVFLRISLDENGEGVLAFTVPDNLTTWRATAFGTVASENGPDGITIGCAVSDTVCTQPFYMVLNACSLYLTEDDVTVSARCYATESDGLATYRAVLTDEAGKTLKQTDAKGDAKQPAWMNFGKLPEGTYSLTVYAENGTHRDALEQTLTVSRESTSVPVSADLRLDTLGQTASLPIDPLLYPVSLAFYDDSESYRIFRTVSGSLRSFRANDRIDDKIASAVADAAARTFFGEDPYEADQAEPLTDLDRYGGCFYSLLPYSEDDPALTAKILYTAPELIPAQRKSSLITSYYARINGDTMRDEDDLCSSLLALASLGEPVLDRLYRVASVADDFSVESKLTIAAAFAAAGDYPDAYEIYAGIRESLGVEDRDYATLYFRADNTEDQIDRSSLALFTASRVAKDDALKIARYLRENLSMYASPKLALASYLKFFLPTDTTEKQISYSVAGETYTETVKPGRPLRLTLNRAGFTSFRILSSDPDLAVHADYRGSLSDRIASSETSSRYSIQKTIEPYQNGFYLVTLHVSGTSTRRCEYLEISDMIPTGARFVETSSRGYMYTETDTLYLSASVWHTTGQAMRGHVSFCRKQDYDWKTGTYTTAVDAYPFEVTVSYVIRGAVSGEFLCDRAVIENRYGETDSFAVSERMKIRIPENGKDWSVKTVK